MSFKSSSPLLVLWFSLLFVSSSSSSPTTTTSTTNVNEWDSWGGKGEKLGRPGGIMEIKDVKHNKEAQEKGNFAVEEYNNKHKNGSPLTFLEVIEGRYQVVAGTKYYITISATQNGVRKLFSAVVVSPATPYHAPDELISFTPLYTSSSPIVGGIMEIKDVKHNKEAQEKGGFAVKEYNDKHQNGTPLTFLEVVKGEYQVVAGFKYYLTILTTQNGVKELFYAVVLSPATPYDAPDELISFTLPSSSPPLLGKPVVIKDVKHNKRAQELGKFAVKECNGGSKNKTLLKFVEVVRGEYQVVTGLKYTLDISVIKGVKDSARAMVLVKPGPSAEKELISFFMKVYKQN